MRPPDVLRMAEMAGIEMVAEGSRLRLRADRQPPIDVLEALRQHKADILAFLIARKSKPSQPTAALTRSNAERTSFERARNEWLDRNTVPSVACHCAWCGQIESANSVVVPFGTQAHTWLHPQCWPAWQAHRLWQADEMLRKAKAMEADRDLEARRDEATKSRGPLLHQRED